MPLISVIVPVYNVEKYIHRCVDSILNQTFTDFELILVDDGSPDRCGAICDEYAAKDSRVVVIHQENGGLSAARNAAIDWVFANSNSQWLTFIDSDDWVHPEYLQCLFDAVTKHNVLLAQCGTQDVRAEDDIVMCPEKPISRLVTPSQLYRMDRGSVVAMRKLIHRDLMATIRYPLRKIHEDEYVTYRIVFAVDKAAIVENADFYYYYLRPNSIMRAAYTIKHLDTIQAYENQLSFFQSRKLCDMERFVARNLAENIAYQYRQCQLTEFDNKKKVLNELRHKLARLIVRYRKKAEIRISSHPYAYEVAFPKMMYLYWMYKGIANKIKRGRKNASN